MKKLIIAIISALWITLISADIVWTEPVQLCEYTNIEFYGSSLKTSDGYTLLVWKDTSEVDPRGYVQKYSEDMTPQWNQPVILASYFTDFHVVETSDGNYLFLVQEWYTFRTFKISPAGVHIWDPSSVIAVQTAHGHQCTIKLEADCCGGAYVCWGDNWPIINIQHIDSDGNRTIGNNGAWISDQGAYGPQIIVQPDNHAIISYRMYGTITIKKVNTIGTVQWSQTISTPHPPNQTVAQILNACAAGSYYLSICTIDSIYTQKFDLNGTALWQNPYLISGNGAGYHFRGNNIKSDLTDDSLILLWQTGYYSIFVQKLNSMGQEVWDSTGVHVFEVPESSTVCLARDNNGGCYVSFGNDNQIYAQYVSTSGTTPPDSVLISNSYIGSTFVVHSHDNTARFYFMDDRNAMKGIYYQSMDSAGNLLVSDANAAVIVGSYGSVSTPIVQPKQQGCVAIWLKSTYNPRSLIYYNYIDSNGNLLFTDGPPLLVTDGDHEVYSLKAVTTSEGYTFVAWYEHDNYQIKAQMLDTYGNTLWGGAGEIVCQAGIYARSFYLTYENNAIYVVWGARDSNLHYRIYGQKYVSGIPQWTATGKKLSFDNPAEPDMNHYLKSFFKRYILFHDQSNTYGSYGKLYAMHIDENGICLPPYDSFGNQLAIFEDQTWSGQYYKTSFEYQNSLFTQFYYMQTIWFEDEFIHIFHYRIQQSNVNGIQMLGPTGLEISSKTIFYANNTLYGYLTDQQRFYIYILDADFNPTFSNSHYFSNTSGYLYRFERLFNGNFILMAKLNLPTNNSLVHLYINSNGFFITPPNYQITTSNNIANLTSCENNNRIYLAWSEGVSNSKLYLQQLTDGEVFNEDSCISFDSQVRLHNTYPNPFTKTTQTAIETEQLITCELSIYNTKGQLVKTLHKGKLDKGVNKLDWDGRDKSGIPCASGVYFYRLKSGDQTYTKKMLKIQ